MWCVLLLLVFVSLVIDIYLKVNADIVSLVDGFAFDLEALTYCKLTNKPEIDKQVQCSCYNKCNIF